ncbi:MAG TPA: aminotransferase class V-fold PLP-dependent enzyme [Vicinamibacterales bacterium]|jgi:aromatic-L-amino-acid decarboxylase
MTDDLPNLELSPEQMRAMGEAALDRVVGFITSLPELPACGDVHAEALCRALRQPAPERARPFEDVLGELFADIIPRSFNPAAPGYLAFIPGGGLFPAALADFISDGVNRFTGIWQAAPALVQLEANVLDWFRDWMQFPPTARGLLTTGGSMANFNAIVCARERLLGPRIRDGVLYTSTHVHHSVLKSAKLAGILPDRVREIDVDADFRMRVPALDSAIREDRQSGLAPFMLVSNAGTTNTGAVDPLVALNALCRRERLWHHVDGAYGAFFHAVPDLRPLLAGLPDADSLTLDPHKGLFLPYGTGALLVRDGAALRAAHSATAGYLPDMPDADEFYDPSQHGPDLSRGFPGLRVWLCLTLFGVERVRAAIAEKRTLALDAAARLARVAGLVIDAPPQLSLFAFHVEPRGASIDQQNTATRLLLERVTARGRVMLTGCTVGDRFLGRICVLSFRTRQAQIDQCVEDVTEEAARLV